MTLKEVAKLAEVSPAAVSRYMNGGSLSRAKSEKIREVVEKTGYKTNNTAAALRKGKGNLIGLIIPAKTSRQLNDFIEGVSSVLMKNRYLVLCGYISDETEDELYYFRRMVRSNVSGVIFYNYPKNRYIEEIKTSKIPSISAGIQLNYKKSGIHIAEELLQKIAEKP